MGKVNQGNLVDHIMAHEDGRLDSEGTVELFSYLVKTKQCWQLQGHYGRTACSIIESGVLDEEGNINRARLDELLE